jgi:prepilin-type N-terminal cleavage/methylation domain-containing protein
MKGFTLIELLIVVAIIGLLAAIAVPNYLEAQTRAKIGRVQGDMYNTATAIEMYNIDHGFYAITDWRRGPWLPLQPGWETPAARLLGEWGIVWRLSTPIAYISGWPEDPFRHGKMEIWDGRYLDYFIFEDYCTVDPPLTLIRPNIRWFVFSNGPDMQWQGGMEYSWDAHYDSSNGTISLGNIVRFGP